MGLQNGKNGESNLLPSTLLPDPFSIPFLSTYQCTHLKPLHYHIASFWPE